MTDCDCSTDDEENDGPDLLEEHREVEHLEYREVSEEGRQFQCCVCGHARFEKVFECLDCGLRFCPPCYAEELQ